MNDLILYTTEDGRSQIELRANQNTVWLTQLEMAEHFPALEEHFRRGGVGNVGNCQGILDNCRR